jgi:predicted metal-dependent hydrolase
VSSAIPYRIRRSDRARRARIVVDESGVEVVVPRRMALRHVEPFVAEKQRWIERTLERYETARLEAPRPLLADGGSVPYLGERLELDVRVEPWRTRPHVVRRDEWLTVKVADGGRDEVADALERWYRKRAREEIEPRLDAATARAGTHWTRLSIRAQRTRWASCSQDGAMSFNWRLLLAPVEILDYVVEHEVAHLEVLDHSRRYWRLLGSRVPDYREHERWLKHNGHTLTLT